MAMTLEEEIRPKVNPPPCASPRPEGCAQCAAAIHCHDQRLGRKHVFWPAVALGLVVVLAALANLF
jgi:hypothetical protein